MRVHVPAPKPRDEGDFEVRVNPGDAMHPPFAIIALSENSSTEICLDDPDDARRLVRAACEALRKLEASTKGDAHEYRPGGERCDTCGQSEYAGIHAVITDSERTCPAVNEGGWHCHRNGGHDEHEDDNGDTWRDDEPAPSGAAATPDERLLLSVHGVNPDNPANVRELRAHEAECTLTDHTPCLAHLTAQDASVAS